MNPLLQAMALAEILAQSNAKDVDPRHFSGRFRQIVEALQKEPPDTIILKAWLKEQGVDWKEGRAIDAIRETARKEAERDRVYRVVRKSKFTVGTPQQVAGQLKRLIDELEVEDAEGNGEETAGGSV